MIKYIIILSVVLHVGAVGFKKWWIGLEDGSFAKVFVALLGLMMSAVLIGLLLSLGVPK